MWRSNRLTVTGGFWAMLALALLAGAGEVLPLVLLAALCHELGHLAALALAGVRVEHLRLTAFGAELRADTRYLPYGAEILCTLAGPAVNLVLAPLLARLCGDYLLAGANLLLGGFNLLPLANLDGGRALYLLVCWLTDPPFADRLCRWVSFVCSLVLLGAAALVTVRYGAGLLLLSAALGILLGSGCARLGGTGRGAYEDSRVFSNKR